MTSPIRNTNQSEDPIVVSAITLIVRDADTTFERVGGSSRHWVRDCFLPALNKHGWFVDARDPFAADPGTPATREKASASEEPF